MSALPVNVPAGGACEREGGGGGAAAARFNVHFANVLADLRRVLF